MISTIQKLSLDCYYCCGVGSISRWAQKDRFRTGLSPPPPEKEGIAKHDPQNDFYKHFLDCILLPTNKCCFTS